MEDGAALSLALENGIGIIIGVSSVVSLMVKPQVTDISRYLLPVEVRRVYNQSSGTCYFQSNISWRFLDFLAF